VSLLQKTVLDRRRRATGQDRRTGVVTWLERTCHRRRQARLGRLTPIEYEATMATAAPQAT
jgi:putative transposase